MTKSIIHYYSAALFMLAAWALSSCSAEMDLDTNQPVTQSHNTVTITLQASKGDQGNVTRAVTREGNTILTNWRTKADTYDDHLAVYRSMGTETPKFLGIANRKDYTSATDAAFSFEIEDPIENEKLTFVYPAQAVSNTEVGTEIALSDNYKTQQPGHITDADFSMGDLCIGSAVLRKSSNTYALDDVKLMPQRALVAIHPIAEGASAFHMQQFTLKIGETMYGVDRAGKTTDYAKDSLYLFVDPVAEETEMQISTLADASGGSNYQRYWANGTAQLKAGKFYSADKTVYAATYFKGSGTSSSPYEIEHPDQLAAIFNNNISTTYYRLTRDLDLSLICGPNAYGMGKTANFEMIGSGTDVGFAAHFDGAGHTVNHLYFSSITSGSVYNYIGFFKKIDGGTVSNLTIKGYIKGETRIGAIASYMTKGLLMNCVSECTIQSDAAGYLHIGGLVGDLGYLQGDPAKTAIICCQNKSTISTPNSTQQTGNLVGYVENSHLIGCYSSTNESLPLSGQTISTAKVNGCVQATPTLTSAQIVEMCRAITAYNNSLDANSPMRSLYTYDKNGKVVAYDSADAVSGYYDGPANAKKN